MASATQKQSVSDAISNRQTSCVSVVEYILNKKYHPAGGWYKRANEERWVVLLPLVGTDVDDDEVNERVGDDRDDKTNNSVHDGVLGASDGI